MHKATASSLFLFFCNFSALAPRSRPCPGGGWYFPAGKSKWPEMRRGRKEGVPAPGSTSVCNCIVAHQLSNANKKIVATFSVKSFTLANGYAVNIGASNEIQKSTRAWLMIRCNDGPLLMDPLRRSSNSKFANISHFCDDHLCFHCAFTFHRRNIRSCHCSLFASWTDRRRALLPQLINTRPDKRDKRTSVIKHVNM